MQLNHLDLCVSNVLDAKAFFESCLGFECLDLRKEALAVLRDEQGFVLVLSRARPGTEPHYPGQFHIGFILASEAEVEASYELVQAAGAEIVHPLHRNARGLQYYLRVPGSQALAEIGCRP